MAAGFKVPAKPMVKLKYWAEEVSANRKTVKNRFIYTNLKTRFT